MVPEKIKLNENFGEIEKAKKIIVESDEPAEEIPKPNPKPTPKKQQTKKKKVSAEKNESGEKKGTRKRCPNGTKRDKDGECVKK